MMGQITLQEKLRTHRFVRGLAESQIDALAGIAREVEFEDDDLILENGERSTAFYLLTSGSVAVELRTEHYSICVEALGPGQVFGWSAVLENHDTLFQVRARECTTALRIDAAALQAVCRADSELGRAVLWRILEVVAGRVKATELRLAEMCGIRV